MWQVTPDTGWSGFGWSVGEMHLAQLNTCCTAKVQGHDGCIQDQPVTVIYQSSLLPWTSRELSCVFAMQTLKALDCGICL